MLRILWITGFALGLISQAAFGGIMLTTTPESAYIGHGDLFNSVAALAGVNADGSIVQLGGGVLVSNGSFVSAAHIDVSPYSSFIFRTGTDFNHPQSIYTSSNYLTHPSYVDINTGYDLRMFTLDMAVTDIAPASLYTGPPVLGAVYDMVGYGQSKVLGDPDFVLDGYRRGYENVVDNLGSSLRTTDNFLGYRFKERELGGMLWHGDSGGGWFLDGELAAITHSGVQIEGLGVKAYGTRLDNSWIQANEVVFSTTAVPEPSSFVMLGTAASILSLFRLRKKSRTNLSA